MLLSLAWILLGVGLLYLGADRLVRGAASIGARAGLTPLSIGLTIVAFGTSMPEMAVSVASSLAGSPEIAVGNVVGSNIGNIALVLGLCAVVAPLRVHARVLRADVPVLLVVSCIAVLVMRDDRVDRVEGGLLLLGLALYTVLTLRAARAESDLVKAEFAEGAPRPVASFGWAAAWVAAGLGLQVLGAKLLTKGAVDVASAVGLSESAVGLTVVAIGTSLPELATSVVAASKGEGDIAVGNLVGSNLFNLLGILGAAAVIHPMERSGMTAVDLAVMVGLAAALVPIMWTGFRVNRIEGGLLVAGYVSYVVSVVRTPAGLP